MNKPAFRLAMRVEGNQWVAYCAKHDTMEGAAWMGAVAMAIVQNPQRREAFIELMKSALAEMLDAEGVKISHWDKEQAPESERSGNA